MTPQHGFTDWYTIGGGGVRYFDPDVIRDGRFAAEEGYITDLIAATRWNAWRPLQDRKIPSI